MKLFYMREELTAVTTLAPSTIDEEIKQGRFPKPRQFGRPACGLVCRGSTGMGTHAAGIGPAAAAEHRRQEAARAPAAQRE